MERRIEGALLDGERLTGGGADPAIDLVSVHRPPGEGLEEEEVECSLQQVYRSHVPLP
jgi:hypothetical protein